MSKVEIIMGSDSDLPVMQAAADALDELGVGYEIDIVSAHRTPHRMVEFAEQAEDRGVEVIIAGAGGAAHLPGMVAAKTVVPVLHTNAYRKAFYKAAGEELENRLEGIHEEEAAA